MLPRLLQAEILESLRQLAVGRTAIFIAHRLSTARQCDRIVVLERGTVVEQGSHDELLGLNGRYAEMWEQQIKQQSGDEGEDDELLKDPAVVLGV